MIGNPNKREWGVLERRIESISENCPHNDQPFPGPCDRRISTPGFDDTFTGMSMIACETCGPMLRRAIDQAYGSSEQHEWPRKPTTTTTPL